MLLRTAAAAMTLALSVAGPSSAQDAELATKETLRLTDGARDEVGLRADRGCDSARPPNANIEKSSGSSKAAASLRRLFVTLAQDVRRLPSRENAEILVNGAVLAGAALPFDDVATLGASSSPFLKTTFSGVGKALGREWVQGGAALAAYIAGRVWDRPGMTTVGGDLIEAQIVAVSLTQGLKFAFSRTRPDGEARSFPSGHASAAFATARVIQRHYGNKAAVPAYALALYTSASRLQANSHYASDVIFGAAMGIAIANTATIEIGRERLDVAPVPVEGGVMIAFVRK